MGRSQVKRNQAARGRGRGGRGGSGGGGRGSYGNPSRRKKGGGDLSKLGDNSFRYDRSGTANTSSSDDVYDGLLDDINLLPSAGLSEYYGDDEEDDLSSIAASLSLTSNNNKQQNVNNNKVADDWMSIDIKALDNCLKQISLHERLKIPKHIGDYLQDKYYNDDVEHKKTIAQLREESKCVILEEEEILHEVEEETPKNNESLKLVDDDEDNVSEEEDEDLESWLDDMIA